MMLDIVILPDGRCKYIRIILQVARDHLDFDLLFRIGNIILYSLAVLGYSNSFLARSLC